MLKGLDENLTIGQCSFERNTYHDANFALNPLNTALVHNWNSRPKEIHKPED